ncbi:MAG: thioredoxin family protein [Ktedonobacteraceae bacterium]|nr:thioredoxin family protein [Ktedonobacteraceae bacterium]
MPEILVRLFVLTLVGALTLLVVVLGRRFVEKRRQQALSAGRLGKTVLERTLAVGPDEACIRILSFSSLDCRQCHQLQAPALQRVLDTHRDAVIVVDIDATSSPELTERYQVLTVPSTVVLDATGHVHAVNYGFATTQRLLEQVDAACG